MKRLLLLPLTIVLQQCASGPKEIADKGIDRVPFHRAEKTDSLAGVSIPVLRSPVLEKSWGKPEITVLSDGSYHLHYSKPGSSFESLAIYGIPGSLNSDSATPPTYRVMDFDPKKKIPITVVRNQQWETIHLLDRPIHVYTDNPGSGADAFELSTVTFPHPLPGKPVGSYRITSSSNLDDATKAIHSYMKTVSF
jgi:hypothetical protein